MIHYHGTPVGGTLIDVSRFLAGRHCLVPFGRPDDLQAALTVASSIALDNSAFSHWKAGGGEVDVESYFRWVHELEGHPAVDWCVIPDSIDGDEEKNSELVTLWLRMGPRVKSVPVWHFHESNEYLDYLVSRFETVALGSSGAWATPGTDAWWRRMDEAMSVACKGNGRPRAKLHGLRMLNPEIFQHIPLASADSTNAVRNASLQGRFGQMTPKQLCQRADVIANIVEASQSAGEWHGRPQFGFELNGGAA